MISALPLWGAESVAEVVTEMNAQGALGRYGEDVAARWLADAGMTVLDRNWRCQEGEIDIVAQDGDAAWLQPFAWIPVPLLLGILVVVLVWLPFRASVTGRGVYAVGSAEGAAYMSGVAINRSKLAAFTLGGFFAAVGGIVAEVNPQLKEHPEQVNAEPHATWMIKIRMTNFGDASWLLDHEAYAKLVEGA